MSDRSAVTVLLPSDGHEYHLTPSYDTIIDRTAQLERPMAVYNLSQRKSYTHHHCVTTYISYTQIDTEPLNLQMTWNEGQFSYRKQHALFDPYSDNPQLISGLYP